MKHEIIKDLNSSVILVDCIGEYIPLDQHNNEITELKAQAEQLTKELVLSTDQNDLLLDEFIRVKHLTDNPEIHALCERAHVRMRQKVSVIDRNMMLQQKVISLKRDNAELKAQVNNLKHRAICVLETDDMEDEEDIASVYGKMNDALLETPTQCLAKHDAEVAAKAVEDAAEHTKTRVEVSPFASSFDCCAVSGLYFYANQLRKQAKAGE